jgi:hypothetical protein
MPSPQFRINGGAAGVKASVAASGAIVATLDSTDGVRSVSWSLIGTDETTEIADYTLVQSGSVGQTVTFTAGAAGTAGIIRAEINGGQDLQTGMASDNTRATGKWYVVTADGLEVGCVNEQYESDATFGWTGIINTAIRSAAINAPTSAPMLRARAATTGALPAYTRSGNVLTATSNGALSTQDGVALVVGERLLNKDDSTAANRGVYDLTQVGTAGTPWILTRSADADTAADLEAGCSVYVQSGTTYQRQIWTQTVRGVTLNTTSLSFSRLPAVRSNMTGTYQWHKLTADGAANTATAERAIAGVQDDITVVSVRYYPDAALVAHDTNYAIIQVGIRDVDGLASFVVAQFDTRTQGAGGTGDWTQFFFVEGALTATAVTSLDHLTVEIFKFGTGVIVPSGVLTVAYRLADA